MGQEGVASHSLLSPVWECREEGSAEAAVAAGGEKSSHPLCQHHRIQADIFLFPAVESHPTSCTSQLTSSQDLSQSTSGDEALRQQLLPLCICSFSPGRSLQRPGQHSNQAPSVTATQMSTSTQFGHRAQKEEIPSQPL